MRIYQVERLDNTKCCVQCTCHSYEVHSYSGIIVNLNLHVQILLVL